MKEIDAILGLASLVSRSENVGNKVTSMSAASTDEQYPSAKAVYDALAGKQSTLTFDTAPTAGSSNPVTSGGVYTVIFGNAETWTFTLADNTTVTKKVVVLP